jgi:hypothetical protein
MFPYKIHITAGFEPESSVSLADEMTTSSRLFISSFYFCVSFCAHYIVRTYVHTSVMKNTVSFFHSFCVSAFVVVYCFSIVHVSPTRPRADFQADLLSETLACRRKVSRMYVHMCD